MFAHDDNKNLYHMILVNSEIVSKLEEKEEKTEEEKEKIKKHKADIDKEMKELTDSLQRQINGQDHGMHEQIVIIENAHTDRTFREVPGFTSDRVIHYRKRDLDECRHLLVRQENNSWVCVNCFNQFNPTDYDFTKAGLKGFYPLIEPTKKMECAYINIPMYFGNEKSYVDGLSDITDYSFKYLRAVSESNWNYTSLMIAEKILGYIDEDDEKKKDIEYAIIKFKLGLK